MFELRFIVTGTCRSGTVYMARLLSSLGVMCGHEAIFGYGGLDYARYLLSTGDFETSSVSATDTLTGQPQPAWFDKASIRAESSWMAAPFLRDAALDQSAIIHVVRNPLSVISSLVCDAHFLADDATWWEPFRQFARLHIAEVMHLPTEIERSCLFWTLWNELVLRESADRPYLRFQVESGISASLVDFLGLQGSTAATAFGNDRINSRRLRGTDLSLADIPAGEVKDRFVDLAARLGYPSLDSP